METCKTRHQIRLGKLENIGEQDQHEDPEFEYYEEHENTDFLVYEDDTKVRYHEMTEVDDIYEIDLFIHDEVLSPHNGKTIQVTGATIGMKTPSAHIIQAP